MTADPRKKILEATGKTAAVSHHERNGRSFTCAATDVGDLSVTWDGICFVEITVENGVENGAGDVGLNLSVHGDAIPALIAALTEAREEHVARRARTIVTLTTEEFTS